MRIIKKIKADVARYNTFDPIPAKQSDAESRFLEVTLTNDGEALTVPADSTVTINARRSDGESKSFEGSVTDDGAVLVPLTSWMLELDDIVQCDISVISGTEKLTVMSFSVRVQRASCDGNDISSSENYDILISLIAQVKELVSESGMATLGISGAKKGQTAIIKSVDENGVPQEWEAGDSKPFVVTVTYGDNGTLTADKTHAEIVEAYAAGEQINAKIINYPGVNAPSILPLYVNMSDEMFMFSGSGVLDGSAMAMTAIDTNGSWRVELAELATLGDIPSGGTDTSLGITGATVGQTVKIKSVDENGVPTEWEAADAASGGDGWTEIGELTVEGTKFIISDYTDGVITVTPDNGIYPSVGRSYVIRKPDYSAYINARIVATETEGKFTLVNLDNGAYTPSEDLTQYVIDAPDAWGELVFSNLTSFSYFKIGITIPLLSSHGLRSTIGISGKIQFSIGASCSNLTGGAVEAIIETDESPVSGKDYVKASFKGKSPNRSNGYDVIDFVNKSTSDIIKIGHYNGLMVSGTNVKLWGRN